MGIQHRKPPARRVQFVTDAPPLTEAEHASIPADAPTHCLQCSDALSDLRRLGGRAYCTKQVCQDAASIHATKDWRNSQADE